MRSRRLKLAAIACVMLSGDIARADDAPPALRIAVDNVLVGRVNPLALADLFRIGLAARLYRRPQPVLLNNFLFFGFAPRVTASSLRFGPQLEVQPLSIVSLRFSGELLHFWGNFDSRQSFASPEATGPDSAVSRKFTPAST